MASRSTILLVAFAAGSAIFALAPGLSTTVQRAMGIGPQTKAAISPKSTVPEPTSGLLPMSGEQIKLAQIDLAEVGPATIAKRLIVPGSIVPDADRIAHVSVMVLFYAGMLPSSEQMWRSATPKVTSVSRPCSEIAAYL